MGKLIVLEGLDGAGKSTQIHLLQSFLHSHDIKSEFLHFPRTNNPYYGELIARFLRGELGSINEVNPYLVAVIYAGDRNDAKELIQTWLAEDKFIILDRYFYSNVAYQCAKIDNPAAKEYFRSWIKAFEFEYHQIPKPDLSIMLHVPFDIIWDRLKEQRPGRERDYLEGSTDIHEESMLLQKKVAEEYLYLTNTVDDFLRLDCYLGEELLAPEQIHEQIIYLLTARSLI